MWGVVGSMKVFEDGQGLSRCLKERKTKSSRRRALAANRKVGIVRKLSMLTAGILFTVYGSYGRALLRRKTSGCDSGS